MLAIRLKRIGRKGHPIYRLAIQESQRHPSSGRVVAYVGTYNPHTKEVNLQKEDAQRYLDNGAQPTPRVVKILKAEGVKLPKWVVEPKTDQKSAVKNTEKLRKNQPKEEPEVEEVAAETPAEESPAETEAEENDGEKA